MSNLTKTALIFTVAASFENGNTSSSLAKNLDEVEDIFITLYTPKDGEDYPEFPFSEIELLKFNNSHIHEFPDGTWMEVTKVKLALEGLSFIDE